MTGLQSPWDQDYTSRGLLWGGNPAVVPDVPAGSRILEIGCGSGKTIGALMHRSCDITAIDFSYKAVEMSRRVIGRYPAGDTMVVSLPAMSPVTCQNRIA
jgi:methylase of polypeptide subunit release factors